MDRHCLRPFVEDGFRPRHVLEGEGYDSRSPHSRLSGYRPAYTLNPTPQSTTGTCLRPRDERDLNDYLRVLQHRRYSHSRKEGDQFLCLVRVVTFETSEVSLLVSTPSNRRDPRVSSELSEGSPTQTTSVKRTTILTAG